MKENSIEEDILNIEKYIELVTEKNYCECNELNEICSGSQCYGSRNVAYSMKHILSDYKRVLKENEEIKNQEATQRKINELLVQRYSNSIPVQKIKDKIEELQKEYKYLGEENQRVNKFEIELLQELIEGEK